MTGRERFATGYRYSASAWLAPEICTPFATEKDIPYSGIEAATLSLFSFPMNGKNDKPSLVPFRLEALRSSSMTSSFACWPR
jgi:hypothetical protein